MSYVNEENALMFVILGICFHGKCLWIHYIAISCAVCPVVKILSFIRLTCSNLHAYCTWLSATHLFILCLIICLHRSPLHVLNDIYKSNGYSKGPSRSFYFFITYTWASKQIQACLLLIRYSVIELFKPKHKLSNVWDINMNSLKTVYNFKEASGELK